MTPEEFVIVRDKLYRYDEEFNSNPDAYLPLLQPALTKSGKRRVHQPSAQCSFRNLDVTGSMAELQTRIRTRDKACDEHICEEIKELTKAGDDHVWPGLSAKMKAWANPERAVREAFSGTDHVKPVVLKVGGDERARLRELCGTLGLEHESTDAPERHSTLSGIKSDRWLVVGSNARDVFEVISEISRQRCRKQAELKERQEVRRQAAINQREAESRIRQVALVATASEKQGVWDLTGRWDITCPEMQEYKLGKLTGFYMNISRDIAPYPNTNGDFDGRDGFHDERATSQIRKHTKVPTQETSAEERYYATFLVNKTARVMRISGPVASGKQKACAMTYQWRGLETGEGGLVSGPDKVLMEIVFSEYGTAVSGESEGGGFPLVTFTGVKVEAGNNRRSSSEYQWNSFARAHEKERPSRWGIFV
ncbi:hypothetical protein LTR87_003802 [Friedmanniomyces endolithicus]|nr:hypothetical protein LTR38_006432 [Friedmanniomyces endolithicus]KAK0882507.1 hypothetical protein LTR87_003802 [Friedmanniomyces endolithicus]